MNETLKVWMSAATKGEQEELASIAGTSRAMLYQLASGQRNAGPALARRIDIAAKALRRRNKDLPLVPRAKLCAACGECEFAKKCTG